jgi:threonine synthase
MGFELAEQFDWTLPDWIVYPTGGGTGLIGMWKAFDELEAIGWMPRGPRPKMVSVQTEGCAPIVRAFHNGETRAPLWENPVTAADGLRVPRAIGDFMILQTIRDSGGTAVAVPEVDLVKDMMQMGAEEGVSACPEGAAALGAIRQLATAGRIGRSETVVLFNTGGALKYLDMIRSPG